MHNGKILIMDDEEIVRDIAGEILKRLGYAVAVAKDGKEALVAYKSAMDSGDPFDAVIMDLTIPGGMGGEETLKALLEIDPFARALVSSGYSNDPVMTRSRDYGFLGVITKPFRMKDMEEAVRKVLEMQR